LFDNDGNQIDAYGAKVQNFNGTYYLYGNSFSTTGAAFGIKSYSSDDLLTWHYEGFLFDPFSPNSPCNAPGGCGRPHIVYSSKLSKYVLWANAGPVGYQIALSDSPSSKFTFLPNQAAIDPQFAALQPADFTVETFGDKGYLVFSTLNFRYTDAGSLWPPINQTMHIAPLTDDFTNTTLVSYPVSGGEAPLDLIDEEPESPDLFHRNGYWYIAASNTCGYCNGTLGLIYRSKSIQGPWTRQIISGYSCNGQVEGVLTITEPRTQQSTYIWHSTSVPGGPRVGFSGHIFQPLQFNGDGSVQDLNCAADASYNVNVPQGSGTIEAGVATTATDASPALAAYSAVCDSDLFTLYQTWTASKSGTLTEVAVNIAAIPAQQLVPLTMNVFRFSSLAALVLPNYKYELLSSRSFNASELSYVFNTTSVMDLTGTAVAQGDHLGFSIAGPDFAPYCHLEYDVGSGASGMVLLVQGQGQNSWRGTDGKTSPVYERVGKGVKFFATIT